MFGHLNIDNAYLDEIVYICYNLCSVKIESFDKWLMLKSINVITHQHIL